MLAIGAFTGFMIGGNALSTNFIPAFSAAIQSVCHVYVIIIVGAFATWWGKFEGPTRKGVNALCKDVLLPMLLLAKVPAAITFDRLKTWWLLPVMSIVQCCLGLASGWLVSLWAAEGNQNIKQFIMATVTFPNTTSFPLTLATAMFKVITFDPGRSASDEDNEATALILVYTTFMNIERWTIGYSLLMPPEEEAEIAEGDVEEAGTSMPLTTSLDSRAISKHSSVDSNFSDTSVMELYQDGSSDKYKAENKALKAEVAGFKQMLSPVLEAQASRGRTVSNLQNYSESRPILESPIPSYSGQTSAEIVNLSSLQAPKKPKKEMTLYKRLKKSFNAPSIMAVFAIILGCIPWIRDAIFVKDAPAQPAFTSAIMLIGNAYLCGIFLTLGGNLYNQLGSELKDGPTVKQIVGILIARFILTPSLTFGLVMFLWHETNIFNGNKIMAYVIMLEASGPTAVSLSTICQHFDNHVSRVSILLLYQYAAVLVTLTVWNTLFLVSLGSDTV
jgi:predicted permease